jgi:hypothetical protein
MKQVIRNIDPDSARDLLERVPRACISFACDDGPLAQPVAMMWQDGRYFIGIPKTAGHKPGIGQEVVLLVDEGVHFFDLRAIYIRGHAKQAEAPIGAHTRHTWFELVPLKTVAWDYGALHEVSDER